MAGMFIDAGESQSIRPSVKGSLQGRLEVKTNSRALIESFLLHFWFIEVILVQDERIGEDVTEQPGEGGFAAGRTA